MQEKFESADTSIQVHRPCIPTLCSAVMLTPQDQLDEPYLVWGEEALLKWPGAWTPLITERDAFMARVLAAVASGKPAATPAFIADQDKGDCVF